jgi:uncharacterized membrane protein (UPF0182 family)
MNEITLIILTLLIAFYLTYSAVKYRNYRLCIIAVLVILLGGYPLIERYLNAPEYTLDLINQDTVLIRNVETGRQYIVRPEQIVETLENDNL